MEFFICFDGENYDKNLLTYLILWIIEKKKENQIILSSGVKFKTDLKKFKIKFNFILNII